MKQILSCLLLFFSFIHSPAQVSVDSIKANEAKSIITFLAFDSMKGRGNYTNELHVAAGFIADRFRKAGLKSLLDSNSYFQPVGIQGSLKTIQDSNGRYIPKNVLLNVIGVLEGKSKRNEVIIFSAHYDHVGTTDGDIHNGANDNASGTTAMLLLADYYAGRGDNERTLIFCAFSGEELGLLGSKALAGVLVAETIVTVINIEMIGVSSLGRNAFFITGAEYSNLKNIFEKALAGKTKIRREPNYSKQLFKRSDNYPFAKKGIPAHTIMASDDDDACYHKPCDDVKRIDVENMTAIIRAVATASESIISGKQTPSRVKTKSLN